MTVITDFFTFKYSKNDYYTDLFINRCAILNVEQALNEILSDMNLTTDQSCAYMRLKELLESSRKHNYSNYVRVNINKCYINYMKDLSIYFYDRIEYAPVGIISDCLMDTSKNEMEEINYFKTLNQDTKINILSKI